MSGEGVVEGGSTGKSRGVLSELLDTHRLLLVLGILLGELTLFVGGLLTPLSPATQQTLANATRSQFASVQSATPVELVVFIFSHNLSIAALEMVPILGALLFVLSVYSTGLAAQAIAVSQGLPSQLGIVLLAFPYSLVELSAYAMAVAAGVMLILSWRRRKLRRELRVFLLEGVVIAGVLLTAAAMETLTGFAPVIGFALWLPTGLALAGVILLSTRHRA